MFDNNQFRQLIIRPALNLINLYSTNAEELLIATMAHESKGGRYLAQIGGDARSAKGAFQEEPATAQWLLDKISKEHPGIYTALKIASSGWFDIVDDLVFNLYFSTQMARLRYYVTPAPLPEPQDLDGIWNIYKTYYNTSKGDATKNEFVADYYHFIGKGNPNEKAS
jgi:hypothetical protein